MKHWVLCIPHSAFSRTHKVKCWSVFVKYMACDAQLHLSLSIYFRCSKMMVMVHGFLNLYTSSFEGSHSALTALGVDWSGAPGVFLLLSPSLFFSFLTLAHSPSLILTPIQSLSWLVTLTRSRTHTHILPLLFSLPMNHSNDWSLSDTQTLSHSPSLLASLPCLVTLSLSRRAESTAVRLESLCSF